MVTNNADPFLDEVLQFAIAHPPCLLVVNTVQALQKAAEHLKAHGTVYALSGAIPSRKRYSMINDWNGFPETAGLVNLRVGWTTLREPDVRRTLEINTSRRRWYELDEAYLKAQLPLDRITKFVKSDDAN